MRTSILFTSLAALAVLSACAPEPSKPLTPKPDKKQKVETRAARPDYTTPEGKLVLDFTTEASFALMKARKGEPYNVQSPTFERPNCLAAARLKSIQHMIGLAIVHDELTEQKALGYAGKGKLSSWERKDISTLAPVARAAAVACTNKDLKEYPAVALNPFVVDDHPLLSQTRTQLFAGVGRMATAMQKMGDANEPLKGPFFCDTVDDAVLSWRNLNGDERDPGLYEANSKALVRFIMAQQLLCP